MARVGPVRAVSLGALPESNPRIGANNRKTLGAWVGNTPGGVVVDRPVHAMMGCA